MKVKLQKPPATPQITEVQLDPGTPVELEDGTIMLPIVVEGQKEIIEPYEVTLTQGSDIVKAKNLVGIAEGQAISLGDRLPKNAKIVGVDSTKGEVMLSAAPKFPDSPTPPAGAEAPVVQEEVQLMVTKTVGSPIYYSLSVQHNILKDLSGNPQVSALVKAHFYDEPLTEDDETRLGDRRILVGETPLPTKLLIGE